MRPVWRLIIVAGLALSAAMLSGCAIVNTRIAPPNALIAEKAYIPTIPAARFWGDQLPDNLAASIAKLPNFGRMAYQRTSSGQPIVNILALSGGGGDGAFGAGLLTGWSKSSKRPTFHLVTGVSAGAIIAPFAFLGSRYDPQLKQIWTQYKTQDLVIAQILPGILGGSSLADTGPLAKLVAKYVTRSFLRQIAREYRKGRMLLIGTTNLDAQRPVIWNMGEIAANRHRGALALFRKVIMASAAIPGAFPPVNINVVSGGRNYDELHVDGGVTKEVFIGPPQLNLSDLDGAYPSPPLRRIYIIKNGKLTPEFEPVQPTALKIAARSITTLTKYQNQGDIYRIYHQAKAAGADFRLAAVPASFDAKADQVFDLKYQRALFEEGLRFGRKGAWMILPPEIGSAHRVGR